MMYEPGERTKNLVRLQGAIDNAGDSDDLCFLALDREEIIGYITAQIGDFLQEIKFILLNLVKLRGEFLI